MGVIKEPKYYLKESIVMFSIWIQHPTEIEWLNRAIRYFYLWRFYSDTRNQ